MALHTRRRLLQVATALAAGFAGCGGLSGSASQSSETIEAGGQRPGDDSETDPPTLLLRADSARPPLRLANPDQEDEETPDAEERERLSPRVRNGIVDSQSRSERITVADGVNGEGVSAFVSETDFDNETIYLETNSVRECFRLALCWVSWTQNKVRTNYVRQLRPYDEACADENRVFESRLIRFPVALDADSVNSFASGIGTGQCDIRGGE